MIKVTNLLHKTKPNTPITEILNELKISNDAKTITTQLKIIYENITDKVTKSKITKCANKLKEYLTAKVNDPNLESQDANQENISNDEQDIAMKSERLLQQPQRTKTWILYVSPRSYKPECIRRSCYSYP